MHDRPSLFYGLLVTPAYAEALKKVNPAIKNAFVQQGGTYLEEYNYKGSCYLGKKLGQMMDLTSLELTDANIQSLLKKLVPDFPYQPLALFPIEESNGGH